MKVPCRWLAEYVDIELEREAVVRLAERLTLAGLEVEAVTFTGRVHGAVVGRVLSQRPHPNSDHLSLCRLDIGSDKIEVVCGASNVTEGGTVPVITVDGELPDGTRVETRKIRGIVSHGMICSKAELGLEERSAGIWNFDPALELVVGTDISELLEFDDAVLDIKVTSNRPDCTGIYGIAREVAAVTGQTLRPLVVDFRESDPPAHEAFSVEVADGEDTPRYTLRLMSAVSVGPSPLYLQHRLVKAGMRPLSNVVDVTNYVMLELGHPLHPFDADLVKERIVVRRAGAKQRFPTLDGVERELTSEVLMITDGEGGLAVAGVMGGARSEIREETTRVLLEAAVFDPVTIRRSARAVGIRSEASQRFERGVDPEGIPLASARAAHLLQQLTDCRVHQGLIDAYPKPRRPITIQLRPSRAAALLGVNLDHTEVENLLTRLEIEVSEEGENLTATVPTFRADLTREVDLIEEVGRLYGYDRIPSTPPQAIMRMGKRDPIESYKNRVRTIFTGLGMDEVVTDGFDKEEWRAALVPHDGGLVAVHNPMSAGQEGLRRSLLPGILSVVETNLNRHVDGGMLFEVGRVFAPEREERESVAGAFFGRTGIPLRGKQQVDLAAAKGILANLFSGLNLEGMKIGADDVPPFLHPGRGGCVILDGKKIGLWGELAPGIRNRLLGAPRVILFELDLHCLHTLPAKTRIFTELPRYPASKRDLSLLVPIGISEAQVREVIGTEDVVEHVFLYDLYRGEQVAQGDKSLTYELSLRAVDRTLTDAEVDTVIARIEEHLVGLGVRLRS